MRARSLLLGFSMAAAAAVRFMRFVLRRVEIISKHLCDATDWYTVTLYLSCLIWYGVGDGRGGDIFVLCQKCGCKDNALTIHFRLLSVNILSQHISYNTFENYDFYDDRNSDSHNSPKIT